MPEGARRRQYFGWHWVAAALTLGAAVFLNLDGYQTGNDITFRSDSDFYGEPPAINWTHGWPFYFMVRSSIYSPAAGPGGPIPATISGELGFYSRWPFDAAPLISFDWQPLLLDLAILAALVVGVWFAVSSFTAKWPLPLRFNLKSLFVATFVVAVVSAFNLLSFLPRHVFQFAALGVAYLAMLATSIALVTAVIDGLGWLTRVARRPMSSCTAED